MFHATNHSNRRGVIIPLTAVLLVFLVSMVAFAIDLGFVLSAQSEMQRAADSAALASAWDLYESTMPGSGAANQDDEVQTARERAAVYVTANPIFGTPATLGAEDVEIGYLTNSAQVTAAMLFNGEAAFNSVKVTVRRDATRNGKIPLFFGRVFELTGIKTTRDATAAFINNFAGFKTPSDGSNLQILPFALDENTWNSLASGNGGDNWKWNASTERVVAGCDGVREVNLYPQGTGSPGNRGTVDIGGSNNSTSDLARQIVHGISAQDMENLGGDLEFNEQGTLTLNGDTGISAGVKDELASIIGEKRIIRSFRA